MAKGKAKAAFFYMRWNFSHGDGGKVGEKAKWFDFVDFGENAQIDLGTVERTKRM